MTQVLTETVATPSVLQSGWPLPRHILVAVDRSQPSSWAVKVAERVGPAFGSDLRLIYVLDPDTNGGELIEMVGEAEQFITRYPVTAPPEGRRLDRIVHMGQPPAEIAAEANEWPADLIVVGTHGRRGIDRLMLGSIAEGVLRRAACPVLCVGHEPPSPIGIARILVAVDDSEQAGWAADLARRFAGSFRAQVALAHVVPFALPVEPGYGMVVDHADEILMNAGKEFLSKFYWCQGGSPPTRIVRQGPAAQEILVAAREWKADLIVLGTHSRRGLSRLLLGSTAEAVVRQSACPVLCVSHGPQNVSNQN